jgi:hypothetical protein
LLGAGATAVVPPPSGAPLAAGAGVDGIKGEGAAEPPGYVAAGAGIKFG